MHRLAIAVALAALGACRSGNDSEAPSDGLPPLGTASYDVDFVGAPHDTTYHYDASAVVDAYACVLLQTVPGEDYYGGMTRFVMPSGTRPPVGQYPLVGLGVSGPADAVDAYSLYDGYSSDITGSITVSLSTATVLAGTFDFSSPTVGRDPNFTVRIHGAFRDVNYPDSTNIC